MNRSMSKIIESMWYAISTYVKKYVATQVTRIISGTIMEDLGNSWYKVRVNGTDCKLSSINNQLYSVNDSVKIIEPCGDLNYAFILGKVKSKI
ncbi:hypothetical protein [Caproiciproducens sp.]